MPKALEGLHVLDFSWVVAVPLATKIMAEHGATVVRLESQARLDIFRAYVLYANGEGVNRCVHYSAYNNDKYGMALNLRHPKSRSVIERLVRWADIACENFMPGTLERFALGYEQLRKLNRGLILLRASLFGQDGPCAHQSGFGTMMQAQAGYTSIVGWPDREPVGSPSPYTDFVAPWYVLGLAMAALDHRRQTGEGQCIDYSQMEGGLQYLAPLLLDCAINGRQMTPDGNSHRACAPHGVFRCLGEDRWCAIGVHDDDQWRALCRVIGDPIWSRDQRFATLRGRKEHEAELEQCIERWTSTMTAEDVMERLQNAGVPAGLVANGRDNLADVQLNHLGHFVRLQHPEMGEVIDEMPACRLSETPAIIQRPAPCLGEHTELVCREILGMSDEEFVTLLAEGVFE